MASGLGVRSLEVEPDLAGQLGVAVAFGEFLDSPVAGDEKPDAVRQQGVVVGAGLLLEVVGRARLHGALDDLQKETGTHHYTLLANRIRLLVSRHRAIQKLTEHDVGGAGQPGEFGFNFE